MKVQVKIKKNTVGLLLVIFKKIVGDLIFFIEMGSFFSVICLSDDTKLRKKRTCFLK